MSGSTTVIFVPQGAEYHAVYRAIQHRSTDHPQVLPIPMGEAVSTWLDSWIKTNYQPNFQFLLLGLGGALDPRFKVGDVVIVQECLAPASPLHYRCHPELIQWSQSKLPSAISPVRLITTDHIVCSVLEKADLKRHYQADVVDMEGFRVLETLQRSVNLPRLPVAIIRVISDNAAEDLPDLSAAITTLGSLNWMGLVQGCCRRPQAALRFIRSSRRSLKVLAAISTQLFSV